MISEGPASSNAWENAVLLDRVTTGAQTTLGQPGD